MDTEGLRGCDGRLFRLHARLLRSCFAAVLIRAPLGYCLDLLPEAVVLQKIRERRNGVIPHGVKFHMVAFRLDSNTVLRGVCIRAKEFQPPQDCFRIRWEDYFDAVQATQVIDSGSEVFAGEVQRRFDDE
jgi:hypothetical protein